MMQTSIEQQQKITFFRAGRNLPNEPKQIWLIVDGVVKTFSTTKSGISITLGFWGSKDVVGTSLSNLNSYRIKCISDVKAIAIAPNQQTKIVTELIHNQQQTQQLIYILRNTRIAKRLWLFLQWLANKFGRVIQQGKLIDFKLTHQELADAIGTTRITITKTLSQFETEGLILRPKTKCIILKS